MKKFLFVTLSIGIGLFIPIVAAEVVLQFLPVMDSFRVQSLNAANPVRRFAPNRSVTYSKGWNFSMVNEVRINNEGFVNDQDYSPNDPGPLLAVIGDSFVEALMVPFMETMHGRLADLVSGAGRVYSFAG
ncbi:MAG TPA: hypothetical protein EYQ81_17145, partial [Sneathiellales bacterium]|nr:hypothetical protein [Sneathiellales bacterium]